VIYFAQATEGGPIKIGFSDDVPTRIKALKGHYGCELRLLKTIEGDKQTEKEIHRQFAHLRLGPGEQFQPAHDLMDFIGLPLFVNATPVVPMKGNDKRRTICFLLGSSRYQDWLKRYSQFKRLPVALLVEHALAKMAEIDRFEAPPGRYEKD
jgi:hypothetical protein